MQEGKIGRFSRKGQHIWNFAHWALQRAVLITIWYATPACPALASQAYLSGDGYQCFCPFMDRTVSYAFDLKTKVTANAELSKIRVVGIARVATCAKQSASENGTVWLHTIELEDVQLLKSYAGSGSDTETSLSRQPLISGSFEQHRCEDVARTWISPDLSQEQKNLLNGIAADLIFA
eukprot:2068074-Rhodomonas_salina.1